MKLNIISVLMAVLLSTSAFAYVDVTYHFNVPNAEVSAYNILNSDGSQVGTFSGSFPNGATTTNGALTIRFPNSLASPYGYGLYYVSHGYVPHEAIATWHTFGNPEAFFEDFNIDFHKLENCRAVVDEFTIVNTAQPNVPVIINMEAKVDASILSAFHLTDNNLEYVPPQYKDEFYSAMTEVKLNIYNGADVLVNTQTQTFNLYADESQPVSFTWTPTMDGQYRAVITTSVVDDQCSSNVPATSEKSFTVDDSLPQNECYTILNDLAATPQIPTVGDDVTVTFTKLSNHANNVAWDSPGYVLEPIPTELTTKVQAPQGIIVQNTSVVAANANNHDAVEYSFTFTPTEPGLHTITVSGKGSSSLCNGLSNPTETVVLNTNVQAEQTYTATFQLSDAVLGTKVEGAVINMNGKFLATDANGMTTFDSLAPGTYAYVITHPNYQTTSGTVTITDYNQVIFLALQPGNGVITPLPTPAPSTTPAEKTEFGIHISTVRISDAFEQHSNGEVPVYVTFSNDGTKKLENVKATIVIQELGVRDNVGPFDLKRDEERTELLFLPLDGHIQPGTYPVRITLYSEDTSRVIYREIDVLD
ncbi:MAG TPA: hypothetical protein VLJ21_02090 [Candidatus Binatia bacterium]|nr:hypothetical protein [Candidatus Binatia bacterium]